MYTHPEARSRTSNMDLAAAAPSSAASGALPQSQSCCCPAVITPQACHPFFLPNTALAAEGASEPASGRPNPSAWEDTSSWQLADALHASAAACHLLLLGQAAEAASLLTAVGEFVMEVGGRASGICDLYTRHWH